ncbi:MAG: thioredoxin reductase, partial [Bacteroidota bacterium]
MLDPRFSPLSPTQIEILRAYGVKEFYAKPTKIISVGQKNYDFFIVLKGAISIRNTGDEDQEIVRFGVNQFTGSSSILSGRASDLNAITIE